MPTIYVVTKEPYLSRPSTHTDLEKVRSGTRLSKEDGIILYNTFDVIGLGRMADEVALMRDANDLIVKPE